MGRTHERTTAKGWWVRSCVPTYEERLHADPEWDWREDGAYFSERSEVHATLHRIAKDLDGLGVPYVVVGALAMYAHGYERRTIDVDMIVTREGLAALHAALDGSGYLPPFEGSKDLRDTRNGVRIDLIVAGEFPGDGKPWPVQLPDLAQGSVVIVRGIRYVSLPKLVEIKLAAGMSSPNRLKDLGDVQSMIHGLKLPRDFGGKLDPSARAKFDELWAAWEADPRKDDF